MIHPHKNDHISIETDGTDKNIHVYAPSGEEIKGIISVELAPIKNDGLCEATIRCYLQPREDMTRQPTALERAIERTVLEVLLEQQREGGLLHRDNLRIG